MATDIVIASAARTPIGSFNGAFGAVPAHDLGKAAIKGALERAKVKPEEVDEVILGQILTAAQGQNPARQAAVNSGIPVEKTALGINQLCGSGLRAVAFGWQAIRNGDASIMVVGGQESMSQAPHAAYMRDGTKMGDLKLTDTMLKDGLWDGTEVRPLQGRDRLGHGEDPQGRRRGRHRRVPAPRHDGRSAGQAAPGLRQGRRFGHRRQRFGHQ
jgi:acetyl-CoA C-acetyltransferase